MLSGKITTSRTRESLHCLAHFFSFLLLTTMAAMPRERIRLIKAPLRNTDCLIHFLLFVRPQLEHMFSIIRFICRGGIDPFAFWMKR